MAEKSEDKYTIDQDTSASITITFDFDVLVFWRCHHLHHHQMSSPPPPLPGRGHSGPRGRRINLSKCMKNQTKWDIFTLNIAFPKTGKLFNESPQKNDFQPFFSFLALSSATLGCWGWKTARWAATYRKTESISKIPQDMGRGEKLSHWIGSICVSMDSKYKLDLSKLREFCIKSCAERRKMTAINWVN